MIKTIFYFCFLSLTWGSSFVVIKYAVDDFPPELAVLLRMSIGLVFLVICSKVTRRPINIPRKVFLPVLANGILALGLPFFLLFWSETRVNAGLAGIMTGITPIVTTALLIVFFSKIEKVPLFKIIGALIGMLGILIIFLPQLGEQASVGEDTLVPTIALFGMALCYALSAIWARKFLVGEKSVGVLSSIVGYHIGSVVFLLFVTFLLGSDYSQLVNNMPWSRWAAVIYLGAVSSGISWIVFLNLIRLSGAVTANSVTYIMPPMAMLTDYLLFGSRPFVLEIVGTGVVFIGIAFVHAGQKRST